MWIKLIDKTRVQSKTRCCTTLVTRETNAFEAIDALSSFVIKPANPWLTKRRSAFTCDLKLKFMICPDSVGPACDSWSWCWLGQASSLGSHRAQVSQHGAVVGPLCVETFAAIWLWLFFVFLFFFSAISFWPFCKFISHRVDKLKNGYPKQ